jgi:hypothetical protein
MNSYDHLIPEIEGVPGRRLGADQRPQGPHGAWRFVKEGDRD